MEFTSFAAERTRDWKLRQLAPVEWTTSFLGKRCRSIKAPRDYFLPMTACKSSTCAATAFPECCGGTPIFHWRRTVHVIALRVASPTLTFRLRLGAMVVV